MHSFFRKTLAIIASTVILFQNINILDTYAAPPDAPTIT
jgi:hypothetical protein